MDLTILIPGIRTELWKKVHDSMKAAYSGSWEIVFIGPSFPDNLSGAPNIQYIHSMASPIACRQMGLVNAKGDWICYAADDCTFMPGCFDRSFSILSQNRMDHNTVVVGKYLEDVDEVKLDNPLMRQDPYWYLNYHTGLNPILTSEMKDYFLINTGVVSRTLMYAVGGWDCQFEACAMACVDLSIRLQKYGAHCILQHEPIFKSTHLPMRTGDHGPIHDAQTQHDEPLFFKIWGDIARVKSRITVPLNNYEAYTGRWARRFGAAV